MVDHALVYHAKLERISTFKWPDWCTEQTERDDYIRGIRQFTTVLALCQSTFRPKAKISFGTFVIAEACACSVGVRSAQS